MLANLDDYGGEVFAPTMSKKSVHLSANPRVKDMDALFYLIIICMELVMVYFNSWMAPTVVFSSCEGLGNASRSSGAYSGL